MAANPLKLDPQRLTSTRRRYLQRMTGHYRRLNAAIKKLFAEDAFGFNAPEQINRPRTLRNEFQFLSDPEKIPAFRQWLQRQIDAGILSVDPNTGEPWQQEFLRSAYRQATTRAYIEGKKGLGDDILFEGSKAEFLSAAFTEPEQLDKVRMVYTRAFNQLEGITDDMGARLSEILADGIANGRGAREVAREIRDALGISHRRALRLARTELARAHAEGQLNSFERLGIDKLTASIEFQTAGDERVCPVCKSLDGRVYSINQARGVIPVHPNCRCAWAPYFGDLDLSEPPPKAAAANSRATKIDDIVTGTARDRVERSFLVDADGKTTAIVKGDGGTVDALSDPRVFQEGAELEAIHTHPIYKEEAVAFDGYTGFSFDDLNILHQTPGVRKMTAVDLSGMVYSITKRGTGDKYHKDLWLRVRQISAELRNVLVDAFSDGELTKKEYKNALRLAPRRAVDILVEEGLVLYSVVDTRQE